MIDGWQGHMNRYEAETGVSIQHTNMGYEEVINTLQTRLLDRLGEAGLTNSTANWSQQWFAGFKNGSITGYCTGAWFTSTLRTSLSETDDAQRDKRDNVSASHALERADDERCEERRASRGNVE